MIRTVHLSDAETIASIYNYYVLHSIATIEEHPICQNLILQQIKEQPSHLPWIVYEKDGKVQGYAQASKWNSRSGYKFTAESSVYVNNNAVGMGIGKALYKKLLSKVKQNGIHNVIGGISLPNKHSVALDESFEFEKVAHFKRLGFKFKKWIDVGYWELIF